MSSAHAVMMAIEAAIVVAVVVSVVEIVTAEAAAVEIVAAVAVDTDADNKRPLSVRKASHFGMLFYFKHGFLVGMGTYCNFMILSVLIVHHTYCWCGFRTFYVLMPFAMSFVNH
jgi:hypothetical protein